ncbi:MAG: MBL fold metallo-hydrolase [Alphaproteobacteria bacterium]|nr:MBL fold metallo-hydrolase [Alphaproteobacteria bacterium]
MKDCPPGMTFVQRGWLSSNHLLLQGNDEAVLIDSGYVAHAPQTLSLIEEALQGGPLDRLLNTHLHSDHCGGNAALQTQYPHLHTTIAPGLAQAVSNWDSSLLTYAPTGQDCPRFKYDAVMQPGTELSLADRTWQVHAAPGHDPHSVILFQPDTGVLVSADALWENGFGVVFPEIEGEDGFTGIAQTLDLIEFLSPRVVIPGHGQTFNDVEAALARARSRLDGFRSQPVKHASHAAKVLLKFKLLDWQRIDDATLLPWSQACSFLHLLHQRHFSQIPVQDWVIQCMTDLVKSGAAERDGRHWVNA